MLDSDLGSLAAELSLFVWFWFLFVVVVVVAILSEPVSNVSSQADTPLRIIDLEADGAMSSIKENHKLKGEQVTKQTSSEKSFSSSSLVWMPGFMSIVGTNKE